MARRSRHPSHEVEAPIPGEMPGGLEDMMAIEDPDLADMNNPDVTNLGEPPIVGRRPGDTFEMFGEAADMPGRPSTPLLYGSASQFPTATQLRVWRWENGTPVGIGVIDAQATEEDFIRMFYNAMPQPGDGRIQFKLRPIDMRGKELGKEVTITISEHHAALAAIRRAREAPAQPGQGFGFPHMNLQADGSAAVAYEEMGRMVEHIQETSAAATRMYQEQLERERAELRELERQRADERVRTAERATSTVEAMTNKLMESDRRRSEEILANTRDQNQVMLGTLTTLFTHQSAAQREQAERQREMDAMKAAQDREFYDRQRREAEERRKAEREEAEFRRQQEREEAEARRQQEREEAERRRIADKEEWERKQAELKRESELRMEREKREMELRAAALEKERLQWIADMERREREARAEAERREREMREERERRDRIEREDRERREQLRRDEIAREEARRQAEIQMTLKQMETAAARDREHAERMMEMARQEREAQREAALQREKMEREAREQAERDRQRQHDLQLKEMEMARDRDREHAERMVQLTKAQNSGGLSAITDMLGMETPELLSRIFGGGGSGEEGGGWLDAIPKTLAALAELGKVAQSGGVIPGVDKGGKKTKMIAVQTPEGIKLIPADTVINAQNQTHSPAPQSHPRRVNPQAQVHPAPQPTPVNLDDLPKAPFIPPDQVAQEEEAKAKVPEAELPRVSPEVLKKIEEAKSINPIKRAKAAGFTVVQQKKIRADLKVLLKKLEGAKSQEEWPGIVTEALIKTPDIYNYLNALTVYGALVEARLDPVKIELVVKSLKESEMVPQGSLLFDEADYAKRVEEEANKVLTDMESVVKETE